ncbi:MAG: TIGR01777 family protein [Candidatus Heimdallarchaeota archaeon]|nr:TIGR01777 family protein [Candidatus Heimdallarchaeota archaeon]
MKILIAGGTGLLGTYLIKNLLNKGHQITIVSRREQDRSDVKTLVADLRVKGAWMDEIPQFDIIYNLVGENIFKKRWTENRRRLLIESRTLPTQHLVEAINQSDRNHVFISMSGANYYPQSLTENYVETDTPADDYLGELCINWESPVANLKRGRSVIFRLGAVLAHTGTSAEQMFLTHKFFVGGWIGNGKQIYPWIHVVDTIGALVWAAEQEIEGIFNLASPHPLPMKKLAQIGGKIMGRLTWTFAPGFVLKLIFGERASILLEGRRIDPKKLLDTGFEFKYPDAESALIELFNTSDTFPIAKKYKYDQ